MKAVVIAAGYATRMGSLGEKTAKALLTVAGRPILEHILDRVYELPDLEEVVVVSNSKFYNQFVSWQESYGRPVTLLDDGSTSNENRLGAIRDMMFAIDERSIDGEVLMIASDNILDFSFSAMYEEFRRINGAVIPVFDVGDMELVRKKHGVAEVVNGKVVSFEEKPEEPKSSMKSVFCYLFRGGIGLRIRKYLEEGNPDAPGHFMSWLVSREEVFAHFFEGRIYAVGTLESYQEVDRQLTESF